MKRSFIREILEHATEDSISFAGGLPDSTLFPHIDLQNAATRVLQNPKVLQYSISSGYEPLRKKIAKLYTDDGFVTNSDEILITSGAQQALDIISRYYCDSAITIEEPSYLGAMNIFKLNRLKLKGVALEHDGIDIQTFKKSFCETNLTYLISDFQNPSGCTYSLEKREKIANIIQSSNGILIEDGPYSRIYFEQMYPSISSLIPKQSFHLGSFSKTLAPALRVGWIRSDKKLLQPLIAYKEAMDLHTNGLAQHMLNEYLEDPNLYKEHLSTLRESYHNKMKFFTKTLDRLLPTFIYTKPKGGMFVYGTLPDIDTSDLVQKCLEQNVVFVPGIEFYIYSKNKNEIRFNFSHASYEEMEIGLKIIKKIVDDEYINALTS